MTRRAVVVAITDRRLMVPADALARLDSAEIAAAFGAACGALGDLATMVQVREKDVDGGVLLVLVRAAIAAVGAGVRVVVNDRLDVALAAGARGVHLPERGMPVAVARRLAAAHAPPGFTIGCSRHSAAGVAAAFDDGADLVHFGAIWPTPGKGDGLGLDELRSATRPGSALVAVGGIDCPERARAAIDAGASGIAVIRAAWTVGLTSLTAVIRRDSLDSLDSGE